MVIEQRYQTAYSGFLAVMFLLLGLGHFLSRNGDHVFGGAFVLLSVGTCVSAWFGWHRKKVTPPTRERARPTVVDPSDSSVAKR
jgi:hypothetical protein